MIAESVTITSEISGVTNASLTQDASKQDKILMQKRRVHFPFVWIRTGTGIKIQDLTKNYYDQVIHMFKHYYLQEDFLCKNTAMEEDLISVRCFAKCLKKEMAEGTSVLALDEITNEVAGALIICFNSKKPESNTEVNDIDFSIDGKSLQICNNFITDLQNSCDIYEHFNCTRYLKFCHICIKPKYRSEGIGYLLMRGGVHLAKTLNIQVIVGIFNHYRAQNFARKIGMEVIHKVCFNDWKNKMSFNNPVDDQNLTCALMGVHLPADDQPKISPPPVEELKSAKKKQK